MYYVPEMGTLGAIIGDKKATITKVTLRGEINTADFNVMKSEMPALTYLDLSQVTCGDNKIPDDAIGDHNSIFANTIIEFINGWVFLLLGLVQLLLRIQPFRLEMQVVRGVSDF